MADENQPVPDNFSCPHCRYQLPNSHVRLLTRKTRYRCDNCGTLLRPTLEGAKGSALIPGVLFTIVMIGSLILLSPVIGINTVVFLLVVFHTVGIYLSVRFFNNHAYLVEEHPQHRTGITNSSGSIAPTLEAFMCPHCRYKFPVKTAFFITRWTRYTCPQCREKLGFVKRDFELSGILSGLIGCAIGVGMPFAIKPLWGFWGVMIAFVVFIVLAFLIGGYCSYKYLHLEQVDA